MQRTIRTWEELEVAVKKLGLLPYFINKIPGYSVEEMVPENILWDINDGPWEWKGRVIRNLNVAYGKFFNNRAGYISLEYFPHFINYRRNTVKLSVDSEEKRIYDILVEHESLLSKELKNLAGCGRRSKPRKSANPFENMPLLDSKPVIAEKISDSRFESCITKLQMAGFVTIADFEYLYDKQGNSYGWGVARYTTPEALYGMESAGCQPEESFEIILGKLRENLPQVSPALLSRLI